MIIRYKKLSEKAVTPVYSSDGAAGLDLTATRLTEHAEYYEFHTDIAMEIPEGYVGLLFPRSSITTTRASLANSVGVIDSDYRGEITMRFRQGGGYKPGDRIGQLVVVPANQVSLEEVSELSATIRGSGRYGSTGK